MFIHRGESFGSTGSVSNAPRKPRVPDLVLNDDEVGYSPLPCIQVTQVYDPDDNSGEQLNNFGTSLSVEPSSRRASIGTVEDSATASPQGLKARGRTSRRVSLIPGEALEQAHAAIDKLQLQSRRGSAGSQTSVLGDRNSEYSTTLEQVLRTSLQNTRQLQLDAALAKSRRASCRESCDSDGLALKEPNGLDCRSRDMRRSSTCDGESSIASPIRMKSNQRWMKLRTTVQLSSALSSSMNRAKPALKREDSFIKRFSTRQIAEVQDTVDQTDEEDVSKTSTGSPKFRRKRRKRNPITVINPYGNAFFYWLCVLTICVLYNLWTAIVREAFPELQTGWQTLWYTLDAITDFSYIMDILIQFRTGYLEQGLIVYDSKKLANHYLESRNFLLDMFAVIPLDLGQIFMGTMHPILRFPRFVKVYRVYNYYYMVESRTLYPNFLRVLNLVHILLLLAHWFGCFYYMLSELEKFKGEWTYPYNYGEEFRTLTRKYLGSVYWSTLTLTTIGDLPTPESDTQYIFTITSYLIGVFIFATIVGQVGNVITNRNANRLEFERLLDGAKLYMRHHKVPREMQRRVQRWYDYSWSRRGRIQGGGDINSALGLLPDKLRTELALHVNLSTLKKVSIFKECQPEFLHDLVLKMKAYIFTPGDLICRKGEVAREMFIIADGILEVISEVGRVLTTMKAGDFFGEIGILNLDGLNKRTADVRSVGYSELFSLSRGDVLAAMKDYPEAQEILQSLGHKRLRDARNPVVMKPESISSSKRGSLTTNQNSSSDDHRQSKRTTIKLKSDISSIRKVFRRSKAVPRDIENLELEPLSPDRVSFEDEGPTSVKKILKKLGRETGSGSSDSGGASRGVLKRMSHVSDESQQGIVGAGLPLLQRLKLLNELEEQDEKQRQEKQNRRSQRGSKSNDIFPLTRQEDEPEVIGEGLPLFARLKLLKAKEDKEREAETKEKCIDEKGNIIDREDTLSSPDVSSSREEDSKRTSSQTGSSETAKSSEIAKSSEPLKNRIKSVIHQTISRKSTSSLENPINDLNKGTEGILKDSASETPSNHNTILMKDSISRKNSSKMTFGRAFNRLSKKLNITEAKPTTDSTKVAEISSPDTTKTINILTVLDSGIKEKMQRSESFRKAMNEGLQDGETVDHELNIHISKSDSIIDNNKHDQLNRSDNQCEQSQQNFKIESDIATTCDSKKEEIEPHMQDMAMKTEAKINDTSPVDINVKSSNNFKSKSLKSPTTLLFDCQIQQTSPSRGQAPPFVSSPNHEKKSPTDGVQKLLSKLGSIAVDSEHHTGRHAEDLVRGVQKILRDKIEDVEIAWESKIDTLQQEVDIRDATIQHLTETIVRMQQNGLNLNTREEKRQSKENIESHEGKIIHQEEISSQRKVICVQISENSNPSSDDEECLFMRCNSIESIIHQSPEISPENETHPPLQTVRSWPRSHMRRQVSISNTRGVSSWGNDDREQGVLLDVGESSTDDDLYSYSSDDDHVIFGSISEVENEEELDEVENDEEVDFDADFDTLDDVERGVVRQPRLNSQDWEVQMLANQLAQDQRGVARIIDRDIASGKLHSPLADIHKALATDNLATLSSMDVSRLEKIVWRETGKLRQCARMYSLDERPVLEDEFSSLYRSRSQLLVSKSSELCRAGPNERRLSALLRQFTSLSPSEQFLLDRLVCKSSKRRRFSRQQSLCEERLISEEELRTLRLKNRSTAAMRRSLSVCSPPPESKPINRQSSVINKQQDIFSIPVNFKLKGLESPKLSPVQVSSQKSITTLSSSSKDSQTCTDSSSKEGQSLLKQQQR